MASEQVIHVDLSPANPWTEKALQLVCRLVSAPAGGLKTYQEELGVAIGRETLTGATVDETVGQVAALVDAAILVAGVAVDELAVLTERDRLDVLHEIEQLIEAARERPRLAGDDR